MFEGFQQRRSTGHTRRFAAFTGASIALYGVGGLGLALTLTQPPRLEPPREIEVSLKAPPPPRPPPPPPIAPPPVTPPPTAKPPPARTPPKPRPAPKPVPLVTPTVVPDEKPAEAEPVFEEAPAETSDAPVDTSDFGAPGPSEAPPAPSPPPPPPPPAPRRSTPINLPEDAEPAEPFETNVPPEYPESARAKGLDARVVLKIVVGEDGRVGAIQVLRPTEPGFEAFVESALRAVKTWRYTPARVDGQVQASFKIVTIPFRIRR